MFFIPWIGSKRRLLGEIFDRLPDRIDRWCGPFVGGGSVLFEVLERNYETERKRNEDCEQTVMWSEFIC